MPSGTPSGDGVYMTVYPSSSHNTDSVICFTCSGYTLRALYRPYFYIHVLVFAGICLSLSKAGGTSKNLCKIVAEDSGRAC